MATERQAPDGATFVLTELTGAYTDVDDDPDSPDADWLVASGNNVNTACEASFPTPTGNPTVGADLQEFRVLFRQFDEAQGGTPEGRIELWENGALVRAGTDTAIPDGGIVLSFTWNANELGTADGSLVECNAVGTKSGGAPGNRNSAEVGAIEWNVTYSAAVVVIPTTASLTTSTLIPTIAITDNQLVIPGTLALTTSPYAPIIALAVIPSTLAISTTTYIPTVVASDNISVTPSTEALNTSSFAPTISVSDNQVVTPNVLALTTTSYIPIIALRVIPLIASLATTTYAPTVSVGGAVSVIPDIASLSISSFVPTIAVSDNIKVTPSTTSLTTNTLIPSVILNNIIIPNVVALNISTYLPTILLPKVAIPAVASLSLTTCVPTVLLPRVVIPTTLAHTLTAFISTIAIGAGATVTPNTLALVMSLFTPTVLMIGYTKLTLETRTFAHSARSRSMTLTLDERDVEYGGGA